MYRLLLACILICITISGCEPLPPAEVQPKQSDSQNNIDEGGVGLGMGFSGRIGIEVAPGLVITSKGMEIGFGF